MRTWPSVDWRRPPLARRAATRLVGRHVLLSSPASSWISRIEAKVKMSQNRPPADIDGVITGLDAPRRPCLPPPVRCATLSSASLAVA